MERKSLKNRSDQDSLPPFGQQATLPFRTLGFNLIYYKGEVYTILPADVDKGEGEVDTPSKVTNPTDDSCRGTRMHEESTLLEANHLTGNLLIILERENHALESSTTTCGKDDDIVGISQMIDMKSAQGL